MRHYVAPGIHVPASVCAEVGPRILDAVEAMFRNDGLRMPDAVRGVFADIAELGLKVRDAERAKCSADVPTACSRG